MNVMLTANHSSSLRLNKTHSVWACSKAKRFPPFFNVFRKLQRNTKASPPKHCLPCLQVKTTVTACEAAPLLTYSINAGQLHADVDHGHAENLPADCVIPDQPPDWQSLQGWKGTLLLLHLFDFCLDVAVGSVPLQGWERAGSRVVPTWNKELYSVVAILMRRLGGKY